jgi:hypothetical protein
LEVTLTKPHASATLQVDGRNYKHPAPYLC